MGRIRVLVADTQFLVADAVGRSLDSYRDLSVVDVHPSSTKGIRQAIRQTRPHVALLDWWIEGLKEPGALAAMKGRGKTRVLMLSWLYAADQIQGALEQGAAGFLPKSITLPVLADGIRRAHSGENPVFGENLARMLKDIRAREAQTAEAWRALRSLSRGELRVLALVSLGKTTVQIAKALYLSERTVGNSIQSMLSKAGVRTKNELVAMARACGLLAG